MVSVQKTGDRSEDARRAGPPLVSRRQILSISLVTAIFLAVAILLTLIVSHVVISMRETVNKIDDERALSAARAAFGGLKIRMVSTTRDNTVWDIAYQAVVGSSNPGPWIYDNWGSTTADYPLYDAVVVMGPDGKIMAAYMKGKPFEPVSVFGDGFMEQSMSVRHASKSAVVNVFKAGDGIALVSSQAIQPFEGADPEEIYPVLTLVKFLDEETLDAFAQNHRLQGLQLHRRPVAQELNLPLTDRQGTEVAFLSWPSELPGNRALESLRPMLVLASGILAAFLVMVLLAGSLETSRLRRLARKAQYDATHDALSDTLNRSGLLRQLDAITGDPAPLQPVTLYFLDLDGFKNVNDSWGHFVGDMLLAKVGKRLRDVHHEIVAVARLGGDEFALLLEGEDAPQGVARTVLDAFVAPFSVQAHALHVGVSIGYATLEPGVTPLELIRRADVALYRAKDAGKHTAVGYVPEMDLDRDRMAVLEADLSAAIDGGRVGVVYQPIVETATRELRGVEALARWSASDGAVSPDVFIPLAERTGLIEKLGLQVLRMALRDAKGWQCVPVSVNISPVQLRNPAFAESVLAELKATATDPSLLVLEVTESLLIADPDRAQQVFAFLQGRGVRIALDDFGAGFASIAMLRGFSFDYMKIDRSIVAAADGAGNGRDVLEATIRLARAFDIPVVAEGVETDAQMETLAALGCEFLQGYGIGLPVAKERLVREFKIHAA
jgi:diguanylate cyclase (GGDEF)-like protein